MNIALDLDGVVCDFVRSILRLCGKEERYGEVDSYYFDPPDPRDEGEVLTREEFYDAWNKFTDNHGFAGIQLIPGAFDGINELRQAGEFIYFISDRRKEDQEDTYCWKRLMGWEEIPIVFSEGRKVKILSGLPLGEIPFPDIFMDDQPNIFSDIYYQHSLMMKRGSLLERGLIPVVFNQPWNQAIIPELSRALNWQGFRLLVESVKARQK